MSGFQFIGTSKQNSRMINACGFKLIEKNKFATYNLKINLV